MAAAQGQVTPAASHTPRYLAAAWLSWQHPGARTGLLCNLHSVAGLPICSEVVWHTHGAEPARAMLKPAVCMAAISTKKICNFFAYPAPVPDGYVVTLDCIVQLGAGESDFATGS
eukprot:GHRR01024687.1.p3 GENE.GHRR01024687.1~~GHRR01024687.1.p3  ORF type:complete len:115 (+),score=21.08 GHRR01024687.1:505-849(+)